MILDKSPFYVEAVDKLMTQGKLIIDAKKLDVIDVTKIENDKIIHVIKSEIEIQFEGRNEVIAEVDEKRRWDIMRNHSATHFLHKALRKFWGLMFIRPVHMLVRID